MMEKHKTKAHKIGTFREWMGVGHHGETLVLFILLVIEGFVFTSFTATIKPGFYYKELSYKAAGGLIECGL